MSDITFVFFTYNEEKRVSFAIKNFIKYGVVIILDGGSNDRTREISEQLGAKFYLRPANTKAQVETQENFDFIKSKINTDWIYWGYVDNLAPKSLVEKLVQISSDNTIKMVLIPLYTYLWGNAKYFAHKGYTQMFFYIYYINFLDNNILSMAKFVSGHSRYAISEALDKQKDGKKFSVTRMLAAMIRYCFIYAKNGYKNGTLGLIVMLSYAFSRFMTYARLYELEHNITLETIENNYSIVKEKMLEEFK